jgi:hypothetical protein
VPVLNRCFAARNNSVVVAASTSDAYPVCRRHAICGTDGELCCRLGEAIIESPREQGRPALAPVRAETSAVCLSHTRVIEAIDVSTEPQLVSVGFCHAVERVLRSNIGRIQSENVPEFSARVFGVAHTAQDSGTSDQNLDVAGLNPACFIEHL